MKQLSLKGTGDGSNPGTLEIARTKRFATSQASDSLTNPPADAINAPAAAVEWANPFGVLPRHLLRNVVFAYA